MLLKTRKQTLLKTETTCQIMANMENVNITYLIENATIVNEGKVYKSSVLVQDGIIKEISENIPSTEEMLVINAEGLLLLPGVVDTHVHFRDPGVTHKADFFTESCAAVAGGVTSVVDMPNTNPLTITEEYLDEKMNIASEKSLVNYGFMLGATNTNINEILKVSANKYAAIKLFMGSSTGNMLVNRLSVLEKLFQEADKLIVAHCEDEETIRLNTQKYKEMYAEKDAPASLHPIVRSEEACYLSTKLAVDMAKKYGTKLHVAHISTAKELELFSKDALINKNITAEVTPNHLWFTAEDYDIYGNLIRVNPAIKTATDKDVLLMAMNENLIDTVATDHAPHLKEEKERPYFSSVSGMPSIQHSLLMMLEMWKNGKTSLENIVEKMCHNPAILFNIRKRGFIREGMYADLVLVNTNESTTVKTDNILYKCGWSPVEGYTFGSKVEKTFVNGVLKYDNNSIINKTKGLPLEYGN